MNFPFVKPATGNSGLEVGAKMKQGVFLVVDDFDSMRKVTMNQLKQLGAQRIVEAANGSEALKVLARTPVTMVLSDWNMPVMTGLDLLKAVRADSKLSHLPFVMITAEAERDRVQEAIASGVSDLLVKPYTADRLATRVERALAWKPRRGPMPAAPVASAPAAVPATGHTVAAAPAPAPVPAKAEKIEPKEPLRPTILVVDDTPDNLHLLAGLFKDEYRVRVAPNGEKALEICHSDNPPDLVLLDIMMPGMDGFEVARRMREHPNSEWTPVIFVTAMTGDEARMKGMELGAVDFVTKPIDPNVLKPRVRNFMRYVELHKQLQADYDSMLEAERLKEDVEHITRHDMKGPLAGVIGLVQDLASHKNMTQDQIEQLKMAEETALQALNMINLSSEIYKIETGRFQLHPQAVPLNDMLLRLIEITGKAFAAKENKIELVVFSDKGRDYFDILGDKMLCYSLFQNLLKNACEAAPEKTPIQVALHDDNPVRIVIENKGVVPEAIRERFFDKFVTAGKQTGTGLGTYSAKLLTEAQNGTITMDTSDATNSTRITVSLPVVG